MTDVRLEEFAGLLAGQDEAGVNALIARAKLMAMNRKAPEEFEPPIETLASYLARDIPVPPILVEPALVCRGAITLTVGRAGKGKTQMNLNRILKWACGRPMFPKIQTPSPDERFVLAPSGPLKILIIENEGAPGMFHKQMTTMVNAHGYLGENERKEALENVLIWGDGGYSGLKLDDEAQLNLVRAGCEKHEPDIVFIEPFRGLWKGDENSSTDMAVVADALSGIATDYDCGVILTHHEKKGGAGEDDKMSASRGSTVLEGVVATMEHFESVKGGDYREISWSKLRYGGGVKVLPVRVQWQPGDYWYKHVPLEQTEQSIMDVLAANEDALTLKELVDETDEKDHKLRSVLKDLEKAGKIKSMQSIHTGTGSSGKRYRLAIQTGDDEGGGIDF